MNVRRQAITALGTLLDIAIDEGAEADAADVLAGAFALVGELEHCLSAHRADSELRRLCARAHLEPVSVTAPLRDVLECAVVLNRQSRGIFDPAASGGMRSNVEWLAPGLIRFKKALTLDLGGIAKGYVIDRVTAYLQSRGVTAGRVNAGGDLRVFGGSVEPVALRFADGFRTIGHVNDGAVAVSSPATHIDGRSGTHVRASLMVVVFAPRALIADALTKVPVVCLKTMRRLANLHGAQWRLFPANPRAVSGGG